MCNSNINELIKIKNEKEDKKLESKTEIINKGVDNIKNINNKSTINNQNTGDEKDNEKKNGSKLHSVIDITGDCIKTVNEGNSAYTKIKRLNIDIKNIDEQINNWHKLKYIYLLLKEIETITNKTNKNANFMGLLITQKILTNNNGPFTVRTI